MATRVRPFSLSVPSAALHGHDTVALAQAIGLLSIVGDLNTGQPIGASERAARLAFHIAQAAGGDHAACLHARMVTRLRWCGASADGGPHGAPLAAVRGDVSCQVAGEVAGHVAAMLGLPAAVETGLRQLFGPAGGWAGVRDCAALASDIEALARVHGIDAALALIARQDSARHPAMLVALVAPHARAWLGGPDTDADAGAPDDVLPDVLPVFLPVSASLTLVADVAELKLPWLAGHARRVALLAQDAAVLAGLPEAQQRSLARAALLHGIGRAAVPAAIWERRGKLGAADWDAVRRAPYWTARAASRVAGLEEDAQLASQVYERLDGSGYFRGLDGGALGMPAQLLAVAACHAALLAPRPWRTAHPPAAVRALLEAQVAGGRFGRAAVQAVLAAAHDGRMAPASRALPAPVALSVREIDVLRRLSLGESERGAARALRLSPASVRTHLENILGKLGCATRPAATLRALTLGLI